MRPEAIDAATVASANAKLRQDPGSPALAALFLADAAFRVLRSVSERPEVTEVAIAGWSAGMAAALFRFKTQFEEAAYVGNSVETIRWLLSEWKRHQNNADEAFWQELLLTRAFALTQLFAAPVLVHGDRFLVGGVRAGGKHGKIADYVLRNRLTDAAVIVELKTPMTPLLYEAEYRQDVFPPHRELTGAVQQVLEQRATFMRDMGSLQSNLEASDARVELVEPHCVVIAGNASAELNTRARRRCFEAYRTELRNVRVVTYDELFARLEGLLALLRGA